MWNGMWSRVYCCVELHVVQGVVVWNGMQSRVYCCVEWNAVQGVLHYVEWNAVQRTWLCGIECSQGALLCGMECGPGHTGVWCDLECESVLFLAEFMFMTIAEDFLSQHKSRGSGKPMKPHLLCSLMHVSLTWPHTPLQTHQAPPCG